MHSRGGLTVTYLSTYACPEANQIDGDKSRLVGLSWAQVMDVEMT